MSMIKISHFALPQKVVALTLCLVFAVVLFSCKEEEEECNIEKTNARFYGKWKLEYIEFRYSGWENPFIYFNDSDIVFEFKPNNILTVTGKDERLFDYFLLEEGDVSWRLDDKMDDGNVFNDCFMIEMGPYKMRDYFSISPKTLILHTLVTSGKVTKFIKI